jgi:methionyl-tRNA synthetase
VNYISFAPGYDPTTPRPPEEFLKYWRSTVHVIGKDILIPAHGVYWPIMLKAIGFTDEEIPTLLVHGWWNIKGKGGESEKMSKTLGNVVDPDVLADKYGAEAVRYYLMSDIATGKDSDFSEERLIQRFNTDLANSLGNLLNRTLSMAAKYREGVVRISPSCRSTITRLQADEEVETPNILSDDQAGTPLHLVGLRALSARLCKRNYEEAMAGSLTSVAFSASLEIATACNELIDLTAPWKLAKDTSSAEQLEGVLYHLADSLRSLGIFLSPVIPKAAHGIFDQLNWKMESSGKPERFHLADARWGGLPNGHQLGKPTPLFPRIELPKE